MLDDYRTAAIDEPFKQLLGIVEIAATGAWRITSDDIESARRSGCTDEAIYDAISVCALFNFYTTWVDASGVNALPDYRSSAARLATEGYVPTTVRMQPEEAEAT